MQHTRLERSAEQVFIRPPVGGLGLLGARLRAGFAPHRHDTYVVALTTEGVQEFGYRGGVHRGLPGDVVVLHPDEQHDGRPGTGEAFAYRSLVLEPARVFAATRALGAPPSLPHVADPVVREPRLARSIAAAFEAPLEPLLADAVVLAVAEGLLRHARPRGPQPRAAVDDRALDRAADYLRCHADRIVDSRELEQVTGLERHVLGSQFRRRHGTSPYRFLLQRRLQLAQGRIASGEPLAAVAAACGFADQAHLSRAFKAGFGLTPRRFARLQSVPMR